MITRCNNLLKIWAGLILVATVMATCAAGFLVRDFPCRQYTFADEYHPQSVNVFRLSLMSDAVVARHLLTYAPDGAAHTTNALLHELAWDSGALIPGYLFTLALLPGFCRRRPAWGWWLVYGGVLSLTAGADYLENAACARLLEYWQTNGWDMDAAAEALFQAFRQYSRIKWAGFVGVLLLGGGWFCAHAPSNRTLLLRLWRGLPGVLGILAAMGCGVGLCAQFPADAECGYTLGIVAGAAHVAAAAAQYLFPGANMAGLAGRHSA